MLASPPSLNPTRVKSSSDGSPGVSFFSSQVGRVGEDVHLRIRHALLLVTCLARRRKDRRTLEAAISNVRTRGRIRWAKNGAKRGGAAPTRPDGWMPSDLVRSTPRSKRLGTRVGRKCFQVCPFDRGNSNGQPSKHRCTARTGGSHVEETAKHLGLEDGPTCLL